MLSYHTLEEFSAFLSLRNNCPFSLYQHYFSHLAQKGQESLVLSTLKKVLPWYKGKEAFWSTYLEATKSHGKMSEIGQIISEYVSAFPHKESSILNEYSQFL